jgi:hypothetical protein
MPCDNACPPSMVSVSPVTCAASSESRKSAPATTSSSVVNLRAGLSASMCSRISGVGNRRSAAPSLSSGPGAMQFTRMPSGAHSTASERARFQTPAFAAAECAVIGFPVQAYAAITFSIAPPTPSCRMLLATALEQ